MRPPLSHALTLFHLLLHSVHRQNAGTVSPTLSGLKVERGRCWGLRWQASQQLGCTCKLHSGPALARPPGSLAGPISQLFNTLYPSEESMDLDSLMSEPAPVPEQTPASKDAQQPPVAPESIEKEVEGEQETAGTLAQQTEEDEQIVAAAVTPTEEEHKEPEQPVPAAEGEGAPVVEATPAAAVEEAQPAVPDDVDEPTLPPTPSVATPPVHTSVPQQPTPVATPPPTATSSFNGKADSKKEVKEKPLTPLPEGLTAASPSVKREVGAVAAWRTSTFSPLQAYVDGGKEIFCV